jgi:hypothetical protein
MLCQQPPKFFFQELILSTLRLIQGLHTISLGMAVPDGIKKKECKRFTLQEHPHVPYVPEKDPMQETVSDALKSDQSHKTPIGEDAELRIPIWHTGMRKAFLMHISTALDAIKKQGTSKAYKEAAKAGMCVGR